MKCCEGATFDVTRNVVVNLQGAPTPRATSTSSSTCRASSRAATWRAERAVLPASERHGPGEAVEEANLSLPVARSQLVIEPARGRPVPSRCREYPLRADQLP